jgi:hypothetical protein
MKSLLLPSLAYLATAKTTPQTPSESPMNPDDEPVTSLSGCSVEFESYFYNLKGLSRGNYDDQDYEVKFSDGTDEASIAFNVCDHTKREAHDGQEDFANMLLGS